MVTMYSTYTAHISSNGSHFLTAMVMVYWTYKVSILGMDGQSKWLLFALSILHIKALKEAIFWRLGSWCNEYKRSVIFGIYGKSEWLLCTLSVMNVQVQMEATFWRLGSWCTEHIRSVYLGMDGQSEWVLCILSILDV